MKDQNKDFQREEMGVSNGKYLFGNTSPELLCNLAASSNPGSLDSLIVNGNRPEIFKTLDQGTIFIKSTNTEPSNN